MKRKRKRTRDPWRDLVASVLLNAVEDLQSNNVVHARDAREFLVSEWGGFLLDAMGLNPIVVWEVLNISPPSAGGRW